MAGAVFEKNMSVLEQEISEGLSNYGHTQLNPPHPVRSAKLNSRWQSQYYGGGPHGNTLCCNFFFWPFFALFCTFFCLHVSLGCCCPCSFVLLPPTTPH